MSSDTGAGVLTTAPAPSPAATNLNPEPHAIDECLSDRSAEKATSAPCRRESAGERSHSPDWRHKLVWLACVLALVAPLVVVLTAARNLSLPLGNKGCLPDGTFAIPGTTSIWDPAHFLSINVPTTSDAQYDFTHAKAVDVVWDLLLGRGLQVILCIIAFQVFSKVLLRLMEREEISFRAYSAVSFQPGGASSILPLLLAVQDPRPLVSSNGRSWDSREASGRPRRSFRARMVLIGMSLLTLYIAALPTLLSAMTGYAAESRAALKYWPTLQDMLDFDNNATVVPCGKEGMRPAWGVVLDADRVRLTPSVVALAYGDMPSFQAYYYKYKPLYDEMAVTCPTAQNTSACAATDKISSDELETIPAPLLNIHVFAPFNDAAAWGTNKPFTPSRAAGAMPAAWVCDNRIFMASDFDPMPGFSWPNVTGVCEAAGAGYRWGFSYHLLLAVCVLNLVAAVTMYTLWLFGTGHAAGTRRAREGPSSLRAAVDIIDQARRIYGDAAVNGTWSAHEMREKIIGGHMGMRMEVAVPEEDGTRRPRRRKRWWRTGEEEGNAVEEVEAYIIIITTRSRE